VALNFKWDLTLNFLRVTLRMMFESHEKQGAP
jgi:hypothetical protein